MQETRNWVVQSIVISELLQTSEIRPGDYVCMYRDPLGSGNSYLVVRHTDGNEPNCMWVGDGIAAAEDKFQLYQDQVRIEIIEQTLKAMDSKLFLEHADGSRIPEPPRYIARLLFDRGIIEEEAIRNAFTYGPFGPCLKLDVQVQASTSRVTRSSLSSREFGRIVRQSVAFHELEKQREQARLVLSMDTPKEILGNLASHPSSRVRWLLAKHPRTSDETLWELVHEPDPAVRVSLAIRESLPVDLLRQLSGDSVPAVQLQVLRNPLVTPEICRNLASSSNPEIALAALHALQKVNPTDSLSWRRICVIPRTVVTNPLWYVQRFARLFSDYFLL